MTLVKGDPQKEMIALHPTIERISQYNYANQLLFRCPKCKTSFAILGDNEKFCHNCGIRINWENVPSHVSKSLADIYHSSTFDEQQKLVDQLNEKLTAILSISEE